MRHFMRCLLCAAWCATWCATVGHAQQVVNGQAGNGPVGKTATRQAVPGHPAATDADEAGPAHSHAAKPGQEESNVDYFWRKSDEAFHNGDYARAVGLHRAIQALDPTDVESFSVASWLLWSMGKSDEALAMLQTGVTANPDDWDMWDEAGRQYDLMKRVPEALTAYQRAVQLVPKEQDSQMLRRRLAHAAERAGNLPLSRETWQGLVRDYPNEPVNKNNLARVEKLIEQTANRPATWHPRSSVPAHVAPAL